MMGLVRAALRGVDHVDLTVERRANLMKTVPIFLVGPFRNTLRLALHEATAGSHVEDLFETRLAMEIVLVGAPNVVAQGARERSHSRDKLARRLEASSW